MHLYHIRRPKIIYQNCQISNYEHLNLPQNQNQKNQGKNQGTESENQGRIRGRFFDLFYFFPLNLLITPYVTPVSLDSWRIPAPSSKQLMMISLRFPFSISCTLIDSVMP